MKTTLINYRTYNLDRSKVIPIDRRSIFGNPFKVGKDGTREEVIRKYKKYFYRRIQEDTKFKAAVYKLKSETLGCIECMGLGCWCTPLPCHGDVIIEYLEGENDR